MILGKFKTVNSIVKFNLRTTINYFDHSKRQIVQ